MWWVVARWEGVSTIRVSWHFCQNIKVDLQTREGVPRHAGDKHARSYVAGRRCVCSHPCSSRSKLKAQELWGDSQQMIAMAGVIHNMQQLAQAL